ncbi:YigZ family protein [Clostridium amylolyticum]
MMYKTIKREASDEFEEKKSTFIGYVKRIETEEEAKEFINKIKSENREARHNVYAYIVGENKGIQRYSDDGEPQGTGGIPVLEVIKKNELTDTVVVVTRYFGGVLLGAGGLTRAYTKGASIAVKAGGIVNKVYAHKLHVKIDYDLLGKLQYTAEQNLWFVKDIEYGENVIITFIGEDCESMIEKIIDISRGKASITKEEAEIFFKEEKNYYENV